MTSQNIKTILFVSDLPKETTTEDLADFFSNYHFQYATLNNSKTSTWAQGYFNDEESAVKAKNELNGHILIPKASLSHQSKPIRICQYEKKDLLQKNINQSLLVKNVDRKMTQKEFYQIFLQYGDIESAKIDYDESGISKGFGYRYFSSSESAEKAKVALNNKKFYDKRIEIVNLLPINSKDFSNSLFIKNFPNELQEKDLKKLLEKYGDIKHVSIARDHNGNSKGYGFISYTDFEITSRCLNEINQNGISFPGLPPLCVKFNTKKKDRDYKNNTLNSYSSDFVKIHFHLAYATDSIENSSDLEKEIRLFIKVIMLQDYNPKEVFVSFEAYTGLVTFNSKRDYDLYFKMYREFCLSHCPSFHCVPYVVKKENQPMMMLQRQMINMNINNSINYQREYIPSHRNMQQQRESINNSPKLLHNKQLLNNGNSKIRNRQNQQQTIIQKALILPGPYPRPLIEQMPMNIKQEQKPKMASRRTKYPYGLGK